MSGTSRVPTEQQRRRVIGVIMFLVLLAAMGLALLLTARAPSVGQTLGTSALREVVGPVHLAEALYLTPPRGLQAVRTADQPALGPVVLVPREVEPEFNIYVAAISPADMLKEADGQGVIGQQVRSRIQDRSSEPHGRWAGAALAVRYYHLTRAVPDPQQIQILEVNGALAYTVALSPAGGAFHRELWMTALGRDRGLFLEMLAEDDPSALERGREAVLSIIRSAGT